MSVELKTAANIKYINIKMKKKLKNNSEIIYIIKDAGEVCVKILLFLLCCENLEKIDFEYMKSNVKPDAADDDEILKAVGFWKEKNILDYEITSAPNVKGANMDNIINIILNISRDINIMNENEAGDSDEFAGGLGIYDEKYIINKNDKKEKPEQIAGGRIARPQIAEEKPEILPEPEPVSESVESEKTKEQIVDVPKNMTPVSIDKLCEALETKGEFKRLIHETQIKMRTAFNTSEYVILYNLYETNNMDVDLILKLAEMCVEEEKNNIRYLEKVALGYAAGGILTVKQYEEKMQEMYKIIDFEDKIRKLFNIGIKKFTPKEKHHIKKWAKDFGFSDDVLLEGYKRSLKYSEKLSFDYINGIYTNWHEKGFRSLDDINSEYGANPDSLSNSGANMKNTGYNVDQFLEKRIRKTLKF